MLNSQNSNLSYAAQLYLWQKRTLYIGRFEEPLDLSQGAATLTVSLDQPFSFITKNMANPIDCKSLILPAGLSVTIDTQDSLIANCNLDALGRDFLFLSPCAQKTIGKLGYELAQEDELISGFTHMFNSQMNSLEAFDYLDTLLKPKDALKVKCPPVDPRIEKVIERIQKTAADTITGEELAESVNLSIPRLAQLFKQQTGIPIRRYRLWHRLYLTAQNVGLGKNLTDAALDAGFTDSSHFAHTFRAMLGMTPSYVLSQINKTRIVI
mgnify:CR=1 FL=1